MSILRIAQKLVVKSRNKSFRHVSLALKAGNIVSWGVNHDNQHAEINCLRDIWPNKRKGLTIVSLRFTKGGLLASGRPCSDCERFLRENGVKKVLYSTTNRTIESLKFN